MLTENGICCTWIYLRIAPEGINFPINLLFDEHAKVATFLQIYMDQFRTFPNGLTVICFMMTTSEPRRSDRREVTPRQWSLTFIYFLRCSDGGKRKR